MKIILFALISLLILSSSIYAQIEKYKPEDAIKLYNDNKANIPGAAKKVLGNERVNIHIKDYKNFNLVTKNGELISIDYELLDNPTLNIYTDKDTVNEIIEGKLSWKSALKNKKLSYKASGFWHRMKFGLIMSGFAVFYR